jgi:hypothetical protein
VTIPAYAIDEVNVGTGGVESRVVRRQKVPTVTLTVVCR